MWIYFIIGWLRTYFISALYYDTIIILFDHSYFFQVSQKLGEMVVEALGIAKPYMRIVLMWLYLTKATWCPLMIQKHFPVGKTTDGVT